MKHLKKIANKIKKSNAAIVFIAILFLFSSFITLIQGYKNAKDFYYKTIGSNELRQKKIDKFSTQINIDYFKDLLGTPVFVNKSDDLSQIELIFTDDKMYVQVITNNSNTVLAYSVTTKDKNFNPVFKIGSQEIGSTVVFLGKTKFDDIKDNPENIHGNCWPQGEKYFEKHYYGGISTIGNYQMFFFSSNISGYLNENGKSICDLFSTPENLDFDADIKMDDKRTIEYRKNSVINTITISNLWDRNEIKFDLGPDYRKINLINNKFIN